MAENMKGKIAAMRKDKKAVMIDKEWYNVSNVEKQGADKIGKGDTVAFQHSKGKDSQGRVVNKITTVIKVVEKAAPYSGGGKGKAGGGWNKDQGSIERQNSLAHATNIVAPTITAKSDLKEKAALIVEIAETILLPYIQKKTESKPFQSKAKEEDSFSDPEDSSMSDDEDFGDPDRDADVDLSQDFDYEDDIPF